MLLLPDQASGDQGLGHSFQFTPIGLNRASVLLLAKLATVGLRQLGTLLFLRRLTELSHLVVRKGKVNICFYLPISFQSPRRSATLARARIFSLPLSLPLLGNCKLFHFNLFFPSPDIFDISISASFQSTLQLYSKIFLPFLAT